MFSLTSIITFAFIFICIPANTGKYSDLFTNKEYSNIQKKRIRREIRNISDSQWNKIAAAMNIMKSTSTIKGRDMYGSHYLSYDDLVCQHARTNYHSDGDMGHIGPHFNIWHRAFTLSFENILISIDPDIEAVPYWDFRIDVNKHGNNIGDSVIFSDKYFGAYSTLNDVNNDYAVKDGKFAYWKINDNPSDLTFECTDFYQNPFGLLRQRDNIESTPFVTRYGGNVCGANDFSIGDVELYDHCLNNVTEYGAFVGCYNFGIHARAHIGVGGTRLAFSNQSQVPFPHCFSWHAGTWTKEVGNVRKWAQLYGCFDCPSIGDCDQGFDDDFVRFECAMCDLSEQVNDENECLFDELNITLSIGAEREDQQMIGDFVDQSTSPNDPIFMFHHMNMDRYLMEWQLRHYDESPYYKYPTNGFQTGVNLDDVISPEAPFTKLLFANDSIGDGPYTIRDIWDGTSIVDAVYTYDTIVELTYNEEYEDESGCLSQNSYFILILLFLNTISVVFC